MADKTTNSASKVLSINFGSYICELEGFANPFKIIRNVVDYFGELADASPDKDVFDLKPDVDHLQRILIDSAGDPYVRIVEFEGGVRMRTLQDTTDKAKVAPADAPAEAEDVSDVSTIEDDEIPEEIAAEPVSEIVEDIEEDISEDAFDDLSALADDIDEEDLDVEDLASMMADELDDEDDLSLDDADEDLMDALEDAADDITLSEADDASEPDAEEPVMEETTQDEAPVVMEADEDEPGEEPMVLEADQDEPDEEPMVLEADQDEPDEEPMVLEAGQDEPDEEPMVLEADQNDADMEPIIVDRETGLEAPLPEDMADMEPELDDQDEALVAGAEEPMVEGGDFEEPEVLGGDDDEEPSVSLRLSDTEIASKAPASDPLQLTPLDASDDEEPEETPVSLRILSNDDADEEPLSLRNEPPKRNLRIIRTDEEEEPRSDDSSDLDDRANDSELSAFARQMGAASLPELLEASAAFVTLVDNQQQFSRKTILQMVDDISDEKNYTAEARIKSFGKLLRSGKIMRVEGGQFAISQATRFSYESRM